MNEFIYEEVDTRINVLAYQETSDVAVVTKDADVLPLLLKTYAHYNIKQD